MYVTYVNKYPKEESKVCWDSFFEECQHILNCCIELRETLYYSPNENYLYHVIPNSETNSFITSNISSIEGNLQGRRNDLPTTLMGAHFHPSHSCVVWLTRVYELIGVWKFWVWCGGVVRLWVPKSLFVLKWFKLGFRTCCVRRMFSSWLFWSLV